MVSQSCTLCRKPSLPGLVRGAGKCLYHWSAGVWGKAWADELEHRRSLRRWPNANLARCSSARCW